MSVTAARAAAVRHFVQYIKVVGARIAAPEVGLDGGPKAEQDEQAENAF
ncbi:MAG: hypothetical protein JNK87_23995 [Bryobacterales bacterium]|nr:hypothetical protein [Bryobacterales bacterium]